jgi:polygalacturonase
VDGGDLARLGRPHLSVVKQRPQNTAARLSRQSPWLTVALALSAAAAAAPQTQIGICGARAYGAKGNGGTLSTAAIQRAIDACASAGGGTVLLDAGTFLSGTLVLKDNVTLRIAPGATLLASPRIGDFTPYPPEDVAKIAIDGSTQNKGNGPYHLIHAQGARNVAIDGGGTIRGNGAAYWDPDPEQVFVSRRPRPSPLIEFVETRGIRIENITIRDAPGWTIHPLESSNIRISGITLVNDGRGPNTDGVNIDSSSDVLVTDSHIEAGDDCVVLKTTGRRGGRPVPPTERVVVSNILCSSDDQGIKIGTESLGDFRDILFTNSMIYHSPNLYRPPTAGISMSMVDGAQFSNVIVSNIVIRDARTPIFLRLGNRGRGQAVPSPGAVSSVIFSNIVATGGTLASSITGLPGHPVRGVTLSDVDITMTGGGGPMEIYVPEAASDYPHAPMFGALPASGLYVRHVDGLTMRNVRLKTADPDERPALLLDDVADVDLDNVSRRNSKTIGERKAK